MRLSPLHTLALSTAIIVASVAANAVAKNTKPSTTESGWDRAVSAPNVKVSGYGGAEDGQIRANVAAQASAPVGDNFGVQVDALYGYGAGNQNHGVGGHFFYRDPKQFLAGVTAMAAKQDQTEFNRFGVEAEIYLDDFTLSPAGGYQDGDNRLGKSAFYTAEGSYYANDNLKYTLGATGFDGNNTGFGKAEWQPTSEPYTVFAFGGAGNKGNAFLLAGASYTFGAPATTLKKRDRTGDPDNIVKTAATYVGSVVNSITSNAPRRPATGGNNT